MYVLPFKKYIYGKHKFVFLGRQMINGSQHLLLQQTFPSMHTMYFAIMKALAMTVMTSQNPPCTIRKRLMKKRNGPTYHS